MGGDNEMNDDEFFCVRTIGSITIRGAKLPDEDPDLSHLGEYSDQPGPGKFIDREKRGDQGRGTYRYFNEGCGDPEYIEEDYKRAEAYNRGEWAMLGIRAEVVRNDHVIGSSPGLWSVESDSDDSHFESIFREELGEALKDARETLRRESCHGSSAPCTKCTSGKGE